MGSTTGRGMASSPLQRKGRGQGGLTVVEALREQGDSGGIRTLPIAQIAPNPENPPAREEDVADLAASIREVGVLTPVTVMPTAAYLMQKPEAAETIAGRAWVVLAGHRRRAAALLADVAEVPAIVREDLAGQSAEVMLHENLHRLDLTPIEEAHGYAAALAARGCSQRELATRLGVSQSQISKRLALLTLPEELQALVGQGSLSVVDAASILEAGAEVAAEMVILLADGTMRGRGVSVLMSIAANRIHERASLALAQQIATERKAQVVPYNDVEKALATRNRWNHRLTTEKDIKAAQKRGDLIVAPSRERYSTKPEFYRVSLPERRATEQEETKARRERDRLLARNRKVAAKARMAFLVEIAAAKTPASATMQGLLVAAVLDGVALGANRTHAAHKLAVAAGLSSEDTGDWQWRNTMVLETDPARRLRLAYLCFLGSVESEISNDTYRSTWGAVEIAYIEHLISRGYAPTEWESDRLTASRERLNQARAAATKDGDDDE